MGHICFKIVTLGVRVIEIMLNYFSPGCRPLEGSCGGNNLCLVGNYSTRSRMNGNERLPNQSCWVWPTGVIKGGARAGLGQLQ